MCRLKHIMSIDERRRDEPTFKPLSKYRTLIIGLVIVIVFPWRSIHHPGRSGRRAHRLTWTRWMSWRIATMNVSPATGRQSPGIVDQFSHSTMAAAEVTCRDCHEVSADYPGAVEHEGDYVLASPTTARCEKCHEAEVAQYYQSRHSLPSWVAVARFKRPPSRTDGDV